MEAHEYDTMYAVENDHWWYRGLRALLTEALNAELRKPGNRILDVGCGTGANMAMLRDSGTVMGTDISLQALEKCSERGLSTLVRGSALDLPYRDDSFDAVVMMDVLYHRAVTDKQRPMQEARRVLRDGGLLVLNVPAYQWLYSSHDAIIHTDKRFTLGEILSLLSDASFDCVKATYWNTLLFPLIVATRLWRRLFPKSGSDLAGYRETMLTWLFSLCLSIERRLMRLGRLPFGLSVFVVARKMSPSG